MVASMLTESIFILENFQFKIPPDSVLDLPITFKAVLPEKLLPPPLESPKFNLTANASAISSPGND